MNILSIDVGIKHLAICVLHYSNNTYSINCWDVIDLCNTQKYICTSVQKNGKKCTNNAKYKKMDCLYCKKHAKNSDFFIPTKELSQKKIKNYKISQLKNIIEKYKIPFSYDKSKKITYKFQMIETLLDIVQNKYLESLSSGPNANHFNLVTLGINLKEKFNKIFDYKTIDIVVIENQIGPLALRMKSLQGMIMQHFIENDITKIIEVSSSNKLKDFLNGKKTTYAERKKISIQITRDLLYKNNSISKWMETFNKSKKKDDLADCFLQGLWYIKHKI